MNNSEKHIIEIALENVENNTATEEQKIIAQLYNTIALRKSLDDVYKKIKPLNAKDKTIKETFENLENAIQHAYNTLYEPCGCSYSYTIYNIIEYVEDFLAEKVNTDSKKNPSKVFILLSAREYMKEDKWYSLNEIAKLINENIVGIDYDKKITRLNIAPLITWCVEENYFTEKRAENNRFRFFMKTNKEYLDLI